MEKDANNVFNYNGFVVDFFLFLLHVLITLLVANSVFVTYYGRVVGCYQSWAFFFFFLFFVNNKIGIAKYFVVIFHLYLEICLIIASTLSLLKYDFVFLSQ